MNRRNDSMVPPASHCTGFIMLRSIGLVTFLALLMVGCGGGGGGSGGGSPTTYSIGGTVTGLTGSGLVLQSSAGDLVAVPKAGAFTFAYQLNNGDSYAVTVKTQPSNPAEKCTIANGSGTVGMANVITVAVTCSPVENYTVRGTVSGLVGSGLTLEICQLIGRGGHRIFPCATLQIATNGAFTLDSAVPESSGGVVVEITRQPSSPWQQCRMSQSTFSSPSATDASVTLGCASFTYVTNFADDTLSAYSIDPTTGALAVIGTPMVAGVSPYATANLDFAPVYNINRFVFVGNEGSDDVSVFVVDSATGALTAAPGSPYPAGKDPKAMVPVGYVDGWNLYVANAGSDTVSGYSIDLNTGALAEFSTIATDKGPTSIVTSLGYAFVANSGGSNDISAFYVGQRTDAPSPVPGSPFPAGGNPLSLAIGAGKFLYSANPDATNPSISGFGIDPATGALSPLSGSPFPLPVSHYIATDASGAYLYVTSGAAILGYAIDANTGALTALQGFPVAAGANAYSITVDPTNQFLYVANDGAANVTGFKLNASTGALTPMAGSPFPAGHHPDFIVTTF